MAKKNPVGFDRPYRPSRRKNPVTVGVMRIPTVHLNGTSPEQLLEPLMEAYRAVGVAMRALDDASPNGRDYYPQGPDAVQEAMNEHRRRAEKLRSVREELEALVMGVQDQIDEIEARRNPDEAVWLEEG